MEDKRAITFNTPSPSKALPYEQWTRCELIHHADELGIAGRWDLTKSELIIALRDRESGKDAT